MKIVINGTESNFDEVEIIEDIGEIAKQFTLLEKSKSKNFNQGDYVEIYNNNNKLLIKGQIEYIEAIATEKDSSFVFLEELLKLNKIKTLTLRNGYIYNDNYNIFLNFISVIRSN